jgi:tricorn protease
MKRIAILVLALWLGALAPARAHEAKLVRYPHAHNGRVVFSYLGDLWTADDDGKNIQRLTAHKARDVYPRFSPDGQWIAFSSDRNGNLDVFLIPTAGGMVKALTTHSADDHVLGWTPDSKAVLFASQRGEDFMGKLYTVSVDGGMPRNAGPDMGVAGSYSPDGTKLAVNRKAQSYWRKYYRGAYQSDVTVMDLSAKTFKDLTTFDGMDSWPMWSQDGHIYFVSDRDGKGLTNIWRVAESGGDAEKVTSFTSGDVRWPALSTDGKSIVFEHDFGLWKLDLASRQSRPIRLDIAAETQENLTEWRDFNSQVDDYDVAPNGKRIAFSIHGEVFTAPTDEGDLAQVTDGAARDQNVEYSPDGKSLAYVSDKSGREEIYVAPADATGEAKKVTDIDALKSSYAWSPDSKRLLFTTSDGKLYTCTAEGKEAKQLVASKYGNLSRPTWSPDGKWIAYSKPDVSRSSDVYLIPSDGGEEHKVTFDSANEANPRFSADGKKLYFVRAEGGGDRTGDRPEAQIFVAPLEKIDKDPDDPENRPETPSTPEAMAEARRNAAGRNNQPVKEAKIDWAGIKRRTRQVTRMPSAVFNYVPATDSKTLVFVSSEGSGGRGGGGGGAPTIYSIQDDGKRLNRITAGNAPTDTGGEGDTPRGFRGGFGGGISGLKVTRDGRSVFFQEGDSVYSVSLPAGGGPGGGSDGPGGGGGGGGGGRFGALAAAMGTSSPGGGGGAARRRVTFAVKVKVDKPAEWDEMFDDAWRTMKYRFYDAKMHGYDWDAMRAKYKPLVEFVGDRHELMNIINEMIGELNASHTGASAGGGGRARGGDGGGNVATGHLGIELEADDQAGRYKVTHVYEDGPADKDWIKLSKGDYLIALNGKPLKAGDDYWETLNRRLNRRVQLTVNSKPTEEGAWKVRLDPISMAAYSGLRYDRWVKDRRAMVDKLSNGRVGYLHIQAMNPQSLRKFEKELREFRHKEGLVIDERFNGGGNIEQELLAILVQRPYQVWQPRGTEPTSRPFAGYFGPKVVLQNWRSASNAEMFPAGFRALGLGKVIGTPTMGAVIGTGSYSLIDGSTVRTPGVGVFLADEGRTNMENSGVKPDIEVENSPEDNLAGHDRQLEVAVKEILKTLKPAEAVAGQGQD